MFRSKRANGWTKGILSPCFSRPTIWLLLESRTLVAESTMYSVAPLLLGKRISCFQWGVLGFSCCLLLFCWFIFVLFFVGRFCSMHNDSILLFCHWRLKSATICGAFTPLPSTMNGIWVLTVLRMACFNGWWLICSWFPHIRLLCV